MRAHKAANLQAVILWLPAMARARRLPLAVQVLTYCVAYVCSVCHNHGLMLAGDVRRSLVEHAMLYMQLYLELAQRSLQQRSCRWKLRPKCHMWHEIFHQLQTCPINPAATSCWGGEDFVGRVARIARALHRQSCDRRLADRYLTNLTQVWAV